MSTYAELVQVCTEYQENFAILNGKFNGLVQELANTRTQKDALQQTIEECHRTENRLHDQIRQMKEEVDDLHGYKDRFLSANISLQHQKARMDALQQSLKDAEVTHQQELDQLRAQNRDVLRRVDVAANTGRQAELQKQVAELEERCAIMSTQLSEEKERFSQQLLTAHDALREQQSRNVALEQQYRSMASELGEMRAAVRRSVDLQNEAASLKERHAAEAALSMRESDALRKEMTALKSRTVQLEQDLAEAREAGRQAAEDERSQSQQRIAGLTTALADATAAISRERDKTSHLQSTVHLKVAAAREESTAELTVLRRSLASSKDEVQRLLWRAQQAEEAVESARREVSQEANRTNTLQAHLNRLQREHDDAAQQLAWVHAEKKHAEEQLAAQEARVEQLTEALRAQDQAGVMAERYRMQLDCRDRELVEAQREVRALEERLQTLEESASKELRMVRRELKGYKKQCRVESAKSDALRRKLLHALVEREANQLEYLPPQTSGADVNRALRPTPHAVVSRSSAVQAGLSPSGGEGDVITLLRRQNDEAAQLHNRLLELSRVSS